MKYLQKYFYIIPGVTAFIAYLFTIAPSVLQIDTGELAAVSVTLGIAHPTGYPLFTMLGYIFTQIPLPFSKIFSLNLLAAIYCSLSVSIFSYSAKIVLDNLTAFQFIRTFKVKSRKKIIKTTSEPAVLELNETDKIITVITGGIFLAFSKTFWFQSTSIEVYSLHLFLMSLIILFLIKAFVRPAENKSLTFSWAMFAFVLALGFSNHMTTILIIPAVAYLYFVKNGLNNKSFKQIGFMFLIFFPVLIIIYSYLPIRAAQMPALNWGNPVDWERLERHFFANQYQLWIFSSAEASAKQFKYFASNLPSEFSISIAFVIAGLFTSFLYAKKFFIFNIVVFISTVFYSINYDIVDIDSYFLLAYISLAFFSVFGIYRFLLFAKTRKINPAIPVFLIFIFAAVQFFDNRNNVDQSDNFIYQDYTKELLNSVPKNSIIFSYQWDYFISASYYFQKVENYRSDVIIVDKELLRRSWYYNQLDKNYPGLLDGVQPEVNQFVEALKPFERKEQYNSNLLESLFRRIMTGLISTNIDEHDYFIAPEIVNVEMKRGEFQLPKGFSLVPYNFLFKIAKGDEYIEAPLHNYKLRFPVIKDKYAVEIERFVSSMIINRALYELRYNKIDAAKFFTKKILSDFPDAVLPPQLSSLAGND